MSSAHRRYVGSISATQSMAAIKSHITSVLSLDDSEESKSSERPTAVLVSNYVLTGRHTLQVWQIYRPVQELPSISLIPTERVDSKTDTIFRNGVIGVILLRPFSVIVFQFNSEWSRPHTEEDVATPWEWAESTANILHNGPRAGTNRLQKDSTVPFYKNIWVY